MQNLDHTSASLDMLVQGALSVDDAARQGCLVDPKPLNVDMDVFSHESVVCCCICLLIVACDSSSSSSNQTMPTLSS